MPKTTEKAKPAKPGPKAERLSLYPLRPEDVVRAALRVPPEPKITHHNKDKQVGKQA